MGLTQPEIDQLIADFRAITASGHYTCPDCGESLAGHPEYCAASLQNQGFEAGRGPGEA